MSRSTTGFKDLRSPCRYWLEFRHGKFVRWDKEAEENVEVDLSRFLICEHKTIRVVGYSKQFDTGVHSNEVRSIKDNLSVYYYAKNGQKVEIANGPWKEIKSTITAAGIGGKFCVSLYVALDPNCLNLETDELPDAELVLANIQVSGSVLEGWGEFSDKINPADFENKTVGVLGATERTNGGLTYICPTFGWVDRCTESENKLAWQLDNSLQEYLTDYFARNGAVADGAADPQSIAGEESQIAPDVVEATQEDLSFMEVMLQDGRKIGQVKPDELQNMINFCDSKKVGQDTKGYKAAKKMLAYLAERAKLQQAKQKRAEKPAASNPFGVEEDEPEYRPLVEDDADDIPF